MSTHLMASAARLPDRKLIKHIKRLARRERRATADLIAHLAILDERRLYLGEGWASLFTYCTKVLHLSEHAAYGRIEAARAARRFPEILEMLASGSVNLTTITLLAPHLTPDNHREVLQAARGKTRRQVEELVAALRPLPPVPSFIRRLPGAEQSRASGAAGGGAIQNGLAPNGADRVVAVQPAGDEDTVALGPDGTGGTLATEPDGTGGTPTGQPDGISATQTAQPDGFRGIPTAWQAGPEPGPSSHLSIPGRLPHPAMLPPSRRDAIVPLAPTRYKVQFTASAETCEKLRLAQDLLRHQIPNGGGLER